MMTILYLIEESVEAMAGKWGILYYAWSGRAVQAAPLNEAVSTLLTQHNEVHA